LTALVNTQTGVFTSVSNVKTPKVFCHSTDYDIIHSGCKCTREF